MLVLSRKKGESIMIGEHIELVVLDVEGETIRIGIKAPKHIEVHRKEIYLQIQEANKAAQSTIGIMDLIKIVGAIKKQKDNAE
ncbi:carbon storage regulator CsrA [Paenibacillus sp. WST5]|uniref:Translational regulator CsrA n=2 Tax=Paenibacillus sedimenti TaxID=2770274 RepID=A0A926KXY3_9BACL|nr:carbon storage regulator CsrA [Paenibacillus sedimenti]MBD0384179.1 carbon storage regulator CsrA [Paenibacillus sedimenti]